METGIFTLQANESQKKINLTEIYDSKPSVNLSCNKNINLYLHEVTNSYFICKADNFLGEQITVYYAVSEMI
tara:strand:+ start:108 stop:323 length:216 start_codon:yes stop_codon:yes gene_type:complete